MAAKAHVEFEHFLLTRFNVQFDGRGRASDDWLRHRLQYFETVSIPSVAAQTNQNFSWLIFCDGGSSDWFCQEIERLGSTANFEVVYVNCEFTPEIAAASISNRTDSLSVITSRMDNDDAISADFVDRVQTYFSHQSNEFLNFTLGLQLTTSGHVYLRADPANAFVSFIEGRHDNSTAFKTVFVDWHTRISQHGSVRQIYGHPMWLQVIHENNVANAANGIRVKPEVLTRNFVIRRELEPVSRTELLSAQVSSAARLAVRVARKRHRVVWLIKVLTGNVVRRISTPACNGRNVDGNSEITDRRSVAVGRVPFRVVSTLENAVAETVASIAVDGAGAIRFANAYCVALASRDEDYRNLLNHGGVNYPDGAPVAATMRLIAETDAAQVRGPSFFPALMDSGRTSDVGHFFLGATDATLKRIEDRARLEFPGIRICGSYSPPFVPVERFDFEGVADQVLNSGANIVWVALGAPKQDFVADRLAGMTGLTCAGVGAAFDFYAGEVNPAPEWAQGRGIEWLFRLASEPRRLWRRYLVGNSIFVVVALHTIIRFQLARSKKASCRSTDQADKRFSGHSSGGAAR